MFEQDAGLVVIAVMAAIVYLTRAGGYFIGLSLRRFAGIQPVLEALPGCAFMAILVPAARRGSALELAALACLVLIMWRTNNVAVATLAGMSVLVGGGMLS